MCVKCGKFHEPPLAATKKIHTNSGAMEMGWDSNSNVAVLATFVLHIFWGAGVSNKRSSTAFSLLWDGITASAVCIIV